MTFVLVASISMIVATAETAALSMTLPSGEFIPLSSPGRLVCPQSLTTLEGIGHCVGVTPLGAAPVGAAARGADVFVECKAQMGPPQGGTFIYR